ncbi:OmpH family outer membrane protein [Phenylobacterium sp.]|uniref:OmpH family outer membrane protein n=1 Tax=Phenylobacterium sp. TaxID=1871053 RepID=UPI00272F4C1F|nr:OmpH family outer membrane protein [Phenylobacterium sp.]MDP1618523.1 OmpH family outer membrane protein [Phenylobacterium sp.]MDP1986552.1 OmpH family outer membrane protein [Phenylobacterium sp.]
MTTKTLAAGFAAAAALALTLSTGAHAQQAAAAPQVSHGAAIAGVCVMSVDGAIGASTVGQYVQTRLQQIATQVEAELKSEETAITTEAQTLETQRTTLGQDAFETRRAALQVRVNSFQRKAAQRERELAVTQQKALARVGQEMEPLIRDVYQQRQCAMLVNRDALLLANPQMDITQPLVTALNAKITQFAFDRERLDQQASGAQTR